MKFSHLILALSLLVSSVLPQAAQARHSDTNGVLVAAAVVGAAALVAIAVQDVERYDDGYCSYRNRRMPQCGYHLVDSYETSCSGNSYRDYWGNIMTSQRCVTINNSRYVEYCQ